jgi:hypothetical protein
VEIPEGQPGSTHIFANIISQLPGDPAGPGVQAWALAVTVEGDVDITGGTELDTAAGPPPIGFFTGFVKSEVVDPVRNGGRRGVVSAIALGFDTTGALPRVGTYSMLDMTVVAPGPQGDDDFVGRLRFLDGLQGSGQPVTNLLVVDGATYRPCDPWAASATVTFRRFSREPLFIRGNANDDSKLDISDPIWILAQLFLGGPAASCPDAADTNDDGVIDISDAVYLITFQFLGGYPPMEPYPTCGLDPEGSADGLDCPFGQDACN